MKAGGKALAERARPGLRGRMSALAARDGVRLAGGSAFLFACRIFGAASVYLTQAVIARHLGDDGLGQYVFAFSWCLVLTEVALLGLPASGIRFLGGAFADEDRARGDATQRGFVRAGRGISTLTALVLAVGCAQAAWIWMEPSPARTAFLLAMLGVPVMAFLRIHGAFALAASWLPLYTLPNTVLRPGLFLVLAATLLAFVDGVGVGALMLGHVAVMIAVAALTVPIVSRRLRDRARAAPPRYETSLWLRTSTPLLFVSLATAYLPDVAVITIGQFVPAAGIAQFSAAFRTAFFIGFGAIAVDSASLPRFSRAFASGDLAALATEVTRASRLKSVGAVAGFALLLAFGESILRLFGPEFAAARPMLLVLAAAQVIPALFGPGAPLLGITGHERESRRAAVGGLVLLPVLLAVLTPSHGVMGAAWGVLFVNAGMAAWLHRRVVLRLGFDPSLLGLRVRR